MLSAEMAEVRSALRTLTATQREVLARLHFDAWSRTEIAHDLGITRGRVSQIEKAAVARLRGYLRLAS